MAERKERKPKAVTMNYTGNFSVLDNRYEFESGDEVQPLSTYDAKWLKHEVTRREALEEFSPRGRKG